jgi:hypothetical protein
MAEHRETAELSPITPRELRPHLILFGITLFTVFLSGATYVRASAPYAGEPTFSSIVLDALKPAHFVQGWLFAVPLLSILLAHEFGHYIAARIHRVEASLPYFIPLPFLSPLGTAGAVITMRGAIRSRSALLDIGAAGPLAGMVVALPVLALGLSLSDVKELLPTGHDQEGQCLLYSALKYAVLGIELGSTGFASGAFAMLATVGAATGAGAATTGGSGGASVPVFVNAKAPPPSSATARAAKMGALLRLFRNAISSSRPKSRSCTTGAVLSGAREIGALTGGTEAGAIIAGARPGIGGSRLPMAGIT